MKNVMLILVLGLMLGGCSDKEDNDNHPCYDSSLVHDGFCQEDCPGFEGCDGLFYCNECVAARVGIGPK